MVPPNISQTGSIKSHRKTMAANDVLSTPKKSQSKIVVLDDALFGKAAMQFQ